MRQPASTPVRRRKALTIQYPAPVAGWISNRSLAEPQKQGEQPGAAVLENFFPNATSATLRRGCVRYATLGDGTKKVKSLFSYVSGTVEILFGATDDAIYDITNVISSNNFALATEGGFQLTTDQGDTIGDNSTGGSNIWPDQTNGEWSVVQFSSSGGDYLRGVNGADTPVVFDGTSWGTTPALTFPPPLDPEAEPLVPSVLKYVWQYKNRLYYIQNETMSVWYADVDSIGGPLKEFPMIGIFNRGGHLVMGATWSLDSGEGGGLSEQCIFITSEGEVAVFQGTSPDDAQTWTNVGVYRIGDPLGYKSIVRSGGDILIATNIGLIPLSQAIRRDIAQLSPSTVSYPIEQAWTNAVADRGQGWHCEIWPKYQMLAVALPRSVRFGAGMFVANVRTGAWAMFTGWDASCLCVFKGGLYFGSENGFVFDAMVSGSDAGQSYTGSIIPLFDDNDAPMSRKAGRLAKVELRSSSLINEQVTCQYDFQISMPPPPLPAVIPGGNEWDNANWEEAVWDGDGDAVLTQSRHSISGYGYRLAPVLQISSNSTVPCDVEIVSMEATYEQADVFT